MAEPETPDDEALAQARARALSSPLRLRILRLCGFEPRTNKELADLLDVNPGTMLHHVRTLTQTGFLEADPPRSGTQGAREVPYRATGLSWRSPMPGKSVIVVETFLRGIEGLPPEDVDVAWLGMKLNAASRRELEGRLHGLLEEFKERPHDPDGEPYSLFTALHPEPERPRR